MSSTTSDLATLAAALERAPAVVPAAPAESLGRAVFVGSGDSLASAHLATRFGHRALSAGDVTWSDSLPEACDTVVGISYSGTSGATVKALRLARSAGLRTVAVTPSADSPLAAAADQHQEVPALAVEERVPSAGHVTLAQGVAALCGVDTSTTNAWLAGTVGRIPAFVDALVPSLPASVPGGISILSLPELRSGADFWSLKLIEACGVPVRNVPLEECGHVDYFIGPQAHLSIQLIGRTGRTRFDQLADALRSTGQHVQQVALCELTPDGATDVQLDLATAVVGSHVAGSLASRWGRAPFRGGAVNMDASHIKL